MKNKIDPNKRKADMGVKKVMEYLITKKGFKEKKVKDVSLNKDEKGCDITVQKGRKLIRIEVKTSHKEKGIPDCFNTEFDMKTKKVKHAHYFYIVRLDEKDQPCKLEILSRKEIDRYRKFHTPKTILRLSNRLKTDLYKREVGKHFNL